MRCKVRGPDALSTVLQREGVPWLLRILPLLQLCAHGRHTEEHGVKEQPGVGLCYFAS